MNQLTFSAYSVLGDRVIQGGQISQLSPACDVQLAQGECHYAVAVDVEMYLDCCGADLIRDYDVIGCVGKFLDFNSP